VLEHQQARTATAEGLDKQDPNQPPAQQPNGGDTGPVDGSTPDPVALGTQEEPVTVADASALAALLGGVPPAKPAGTAPAVAAIADPAATTPAGSPAGAGAIAASAASPTAPATMPASAAVTTPAAADAARAASGTTIGSPAGAAAQPAAGHDATPQSVASSPSAPTTPVPGGTPPTSLPTSPQNDASNSMAIADRAAAATPAGSSTATPAPLATPQIASAMSSAAAEAAAPPARGVGLDHAIETVRLALRASAERGVSHARIELHPRELGGIEIHLRQTADGLVARVVAEHATAAQLLQHAGAELRRSLETQGLTLLRLDIGASGEQDRRAPGEQRGFGDPSGRAAGADPGLAEEIASAPAETTLTLPNGALIDVLA
jgi:flagellar hook-length control protein FliK